MKLIKNIIFILLLAFVYSSCLEKQEFPIEPIIEYNDFVKVKNANDVYDKGYLILNFTDGDGDIGLGQSDTFPPFDPGSKYFYNFYLKFFEKIADSLVEIEFPDPNFSFNGRIPVISAEGVDKALQGEIELEIDLQLLKFAVPNDTFVIETFIIDRALHESNIIATPQLSIN